MTQANSSSLESGFIPISPPFTFLRLLGNCFPSIIRSRCGTRMLSCSICPFACRFHFPQGTTSYHHSSRKIDPIIRVENHLPVKGLLYCVEVIWQPPTVISLVSYPVLHDFPVVLANIIYGCGDDRPFFVTAIAHFRGPPTDGTCAFEVIALKEELLTFVRDRGRFHNTLEIRDRDLFARGDGAQCSDFSGECSAIPSEHRIWATAGGVSFISTRTGTLEEREDTTPVIKTREGFENSRVKNIMTWHARNKERVDGYNAQCVFRIRRVATVQRKECLALIRCHRARRSIHELSRGQAGTWHYEQCTFSCHGFTTKHGTCCHATFALSSNVFDAKATGLVLADLFVLDGLPVESDYLGKDTGCGAFYGPCGNSRQHDIFRTSYVR